MGHGKTGSFFCIFYHCLDHFDRYRISRFGSNAGLEIIDSLRITGVNLSLQIAPLKKSGRVKSGDRGGQSTSPYLDIKRPGKFLFNRAIV